MATTTSSTPTVSTDSVIRKDIVSISKVNFGNVVCTFFLSTFGWTTKLLPLDLLSFYPTPLGQCFGSFGFIHLPNHLSPSTAIISAATIELATLHHIVAVVKLNLQEPDVHLPRIDGKTISMKLAYDAFHHQPRTTSLKPFETTSPRKKLWLSHHERLFTNNDECPLCSHPETK